MRFTLRYALVVMVTLGSSAVAQASSPSLSIILPRGVPRGTDSVLDMRGGRLNDAEEVFFYRPGLTVTKLEKKSASQLLVHVKIAPTSAGRGLALSLCPAAKQHP